MFITTNFIIIKKLIHTNTDKVFVFLFVHLIYLYIYIYNLIEHLLKQL
jgi:hypothetical protein